MKIHSAAQLAMFTKAAADADYAAQRGISQELAQQHLDAHKAAGEPSLPARAEARTKAAPKAAKPQPTEERPFFLESRR
jgi:hypothetical protein